MSSTVGKDDGDGCSSGDPPKNEEVAPVNISKELATDSALANLNGEFLLLIFNKLPLSELLKVGLTCRRLFYFFKKSCGLRHKSLILLKGDRIDLEKFRENFDKVIAETSEASGITTEQQIDPLLIKIELSDDIDYEANPLAELLPSTFTQNLFDIFSNLTHLQLAATFSEDDFGRLIDQLNSLPKLTTLHLAPHCDESSVDSASFWHSLGQLQPPALKHLSLCLYDKVWSLPSKSEENKMKSHQFPLFSQLTSFCLFLDDTISLPSIYPLIQQVSDAPHLLPGKEARVVCSFDHKTAMELEKNGELLPYITNLSVDISEIERENNEKGIPLEDSPLFICSIMNNIFVLLAQLSNLVKVELILGEEKECADYPGLLAALASLQHLKAISLDYTDNYEVKDGCKWKRSDLHILFTVRIFSIIYSTLVGEDVVEQFHLHPVFPGLTDFECTFEQWDIYNDTDDDLDLLFKSHGRKLTRRLVQLPATVRKKIKFHFWGDDWETFRFGNELIESLDDTD